MKRGNYNNFDFDIEKYEISGEAAGRRGGRV